MTPPRRPASVRTTSPTTSSCRVIVTENASDFSAVGACPVLFVLKSWWAAESLSAGLAAALDRWAKVNSDPGAWPHWMPSELR